VDALRREEPHVFVPADTIITAVNRRLAVLPEWKRFAFNERFLSADEELICEAVEIREEDKRIYLYQRLLSSAR